MGYGLKACRMKFEQKRCWLKVWKRPKEVWNRWYRGIFIWKPTQTLYILVAKSYGFYGLDWKFRSVKKRCEKAQKRCEIVDIEEFSYENPCNLIYSCSSWLDGLYGPDWKFRGVKKRCEKAKKRCEIVDIEKFSYENPCKSYIFL